MDQETGTGAVPGASFISSSQESCSPLTYSMKSPVLMRWGNGATQPGLHPHFQGAPAQQPAMKAQVQRWARWKRELCPDKTAQAGASWQGGHCVAQGLLREILLIKGTQRSESTVSLCWKLSPPLKPHRLVLVLEGGWQGWEKMTGRLPEKKHTCPCMNKHQTNKSIFKSRPDKERLRMAIQVKPERAMRRSQGKADLGQHSTCVWIQFIFIY